MTDMDYLISFLIIGSVIGYLVGNRIFAHVQDKATRMILAFLFSGPFGVLGAEIGRNYLNEKAQTPKT